MDIASLVTAIGHLGFALAAWRLAVALRVRVDDHEVRITKLELVP